MFTSYESNMSKTCTWLYDTFNKTLRKDFDKAEDTVRRLAKTLREHREEVFSAARKWYRNFATYIRLIITIYNKFYYNFFAK